MLRSANPKFHSGRKNRRNHFRKKENKKIDPHFPKMFIDNFFLESFMFTIILGICQLEMEAICNSHRDVN